MIKKVTDQEAPQYIVYTQMQYQGTQIQKVSTVLVSQVNTKLSCIAA